MTQPTLYIFSGLPASGKSTLAKALAKKLRATYIRIDTIEQGLRDLCQYEVEGEGYELSHRIVRDNLAVGNDVIADSVNPWELTRKEWNQVATSANAKYINIEVVCSNQKEHRARVETRRADVQNLKLPTWEDVLNRDYHPWSSPHLQIDTSNQPIDESLHQLIEKLNDNT